MSTSIKPHEAIALLVRTVNILLTAEGQHYRVTAADVVKTTRDGWLLIALPTTRDAPDWRTCSPPYSTMTDDK